MMRILESRWTMTRRRKTDLKRNAEAARKEAAELAIELRRQRQARRVADTRAWVQAQVRKNEERGLSIGC